LPSATRDGGNSRGTGSIAVAFTDATASFTFDTFSLRRSSANGTAAQFDTSLFRVDYSPVPEPATLGLFGFGALASLMVARRK